MERSRSRFRDTVKVCVAIVVTAWMVALALPFAARAAGQLVTLVDWNSTTQTEVDTGGKLRVGDGAGAMTVDGSVKLNGTANVVRSVPSMFQTSGYTDSGSCTRASLLSSQPAGNKVVITDVHFSSNDSVTPHPVLWVRQRLSGGYTTQFVAVPIQRTAGSTPTFAGTVKTNIRLVVGSTTVGDLFDAFMCVAPGSGDTFADGTYIVSGYLE